MIALLGSLHAHSTLSGDVSEGKGLTPLQAFEYAMEHGLDFLGISDHHKPLSASSGTRFHLTESDYKQQLFDVAELFSARHIDRFVAIPGIEWGTISTGNHINVFGAARLPPASIGDADYRELFDWIKEEALFAQGNHPYSWRLSSNRNKGVGNFGEALFENGEAFRNAVDPSLSLFSIICSVRGGHVGGEHRHSSDYTHREASAEALAEFHRFLNLGFHISPSANQDTHGKNPGTVTAARTGIWVEEFTLEGITESIQANRVFATEDDELSVAMQVKRGNRTYWMGETVLLQAQEEPITLVIKIAQRPARDGSKPEPDAYIATIMRDSGGPGGPEVEPNETLEAPANGLLIKNLTVRQGEYLYVKILELRGNDNPVGDDRHLNSNDAAWTSPVWFSGSPQTSQQPQDQ